MKFLKADTEIWVEWEGVDAFYPLRIKTKLEYSWEFTNHHSYKAVGIGYFDVCVRFPEHKCFILFQEKDIVKI